MDADLILLGAGLSGAAFLAHLLRDHASAVRRVAVVEPRGSLGAGLAYGTDDPAHRVNVAAGRMSLFPDRPTHFLDWIAARDAVGDDPEALGADGLLHPRRRVFGAYVDESLRHEIAGFGGEVRHHRARAVSAARDPDGGWTVMLEGGIALTAPVLVLAASHSAPDLPDALLPLAGDARLVADPWDAEALSRIGSDDPVLVVGTGLTGCDVISSLRARGHRGPVLAVSRRGLLPRPRTPLPVTEWGEFRAPPAPTALALLRRVRRAVGETRPLGRPWEDVIAAIRTQAPEVWGALPVEQRRKLLRHLRPFWDVHRFQCAPQVAAVVEDGLERGWLSVRAATPLRAVADPDAVSVWLRARRSSEAEVVRVRAVVNCTGPGHRSVVYGNPVLAALAELGHLRPDPCRLGIDVDKQSRVLDRAGMPWPNLFVAGPLARGTHGELMGLPQVATQPRSVAASVAVLLGAEDPVDNDAAGAASVPP